jgi:8-oxo-dGTP diphosphatase
LIDVVLMNDRRYPLHPVPGVGAIVVGSKGVLLARRDKAPGKGFWSIPGGGVEIGETQKEAVVREVKEETGVDCVVLDLVGTYDYITHNKSGATEFHFLLNHYLAKAITEKTMAETPEGEVAWFHPDDLPSDMANDRIVSLITSQRNAILRLMAE